jgi:hypothetical protein
MHRRLMLALAPALALTLSSAAFAQAPAAQPGPRHPPSAERQAMHEAMMKQHMEDLKTILRLRPDQEAALQAFVAAGHPPRADDRPRTAGPRPPKALTTPERLDRAARRETEMAARHTRMRQALSTFYAALSPDQQKVFDALTRLQRPGHGRTGARPMIMRRHGGPAMPGPGPA